MKHIRKRRAFAQRSFRIRTTSLRREVANRRYLYSAPFAGTNPVAPRGVGCIIDRKVCFVNVRPSSLMGASFHSTATDTRSNAPARRDEDRVIRPLVCCRQCKLRIVRFRTSAKAHSLHCISSSGKIIRFCWSPIMAYFPGAISSFGAGIYLSTSIRHIERAAPVNNLLK